MTTAINDNNAFHTVAVLGAGVIGASWSALFLAAGLKVRVYDPMEEAEASVHDYITRAWPTLEALDMTGRARGLANDANTEAGADGSERSGKVDGGGKSNIDWADAISFHTSAAEAVQGAQFVQENVPERLELKHAIYAEIEPHLSSEAIVASSASGLMVSEMQKGWKDPSRFMLGHPFNPPHLIPLVELLTNDKTADGVMELAEAFYELVGKVTIRVKREVPAHVANRLQAALWREAIYLVESGVASVEDVDKAVWAGPGLRWAAEGPHMLFHLGAGAGGLQEFCNRYRDSFHRWWDDLGDVELTPELAEKLMIGAQEEGGDKDIQSLADKRDALITGMLKATMPLRGK